MHYTNKNKFGFSHARHPTYFVLSDNLMTLYEVCDVCDYGIIKIGYRPPENIHLLICKSRTDYRRECCSCKTVFECREKHDCCCKVLLDDEIEAKKNEEHEREARILIENHPEVAKKILEIQEKES